MVAAVLVTRILSSLLFDDSTADPAVLAAVALCLTAVALAASWFPARRAAAVDPMIALRTE